MPLSGNVRTVATELDATDWAIIRELQRDARLSFNQIAKRVNLSPPSVATRIRRLEDTNVIQGYHARIDPAAAGLPLTAFLRLRCRLGRCLLKTSTAEQFPEIVELPRLSGDSCSMVKVRTASMAHLSSLLERLGEHAQTDSHVVLATPYENRPLDAPQEAPPATRHRGWND
jgi:Lrp/AsnC family leucine-responsive transcriptional regulator